MHFLRFAQRAEILFHCKELQVFEGVGVLFQNVFVARAQAVFGGNFLAFIGIQVIQIRLGFLVIY